MKRNVTVSLDEETARWARIEAARRDKSVSALIGDLLREYMARAENYDDAMTAFLSRDLTWPGWGRSRYPTREQMHERDDVR